MITRTRFAPSPTGYMHIGNLRTALYAYLIAKNNNGQFILRIEDTDQTRQVEGAIDFIYNTLNLVELVPDEGPNIGGDYGPYIQSQRRDIYQKHAQQLVDKSKAYPCFCTKERLDEHRAYCQKIKVPYMYDQHCRKLSANDIAENIKKGLPYVIRQKMPGTGTTSFQDEVYGTITVENHTLEDHVLLKSDGLPTYNFANVIDDYLMKITHVIRGSEYLSSSPKYNLLYDAFGWQIPTYIHLPPVLKEAGKKLSKREGDASFEDFYNQGFLKAAIINYIALLGWNPGTEQEIFTLEELIKAFSVQRIQKAPAIFDLAKLKWINGQHIRNLNLEEFHKQALPYYKNIKVDLNKLSELLHTRTEIFANIPEMIDFLNQLPDYDIELYTHKKMKTNPENSLIALQEIKPVLETLNSWDHDSIKTTLFKLIEKLEIKTGKILWPLRTALSGKQFTPGGAFELAELLGKDESLKRIEIGIEKLG
ncbi:glutamate--tRNA ligase [bacterium]|nr:glutamate--tRNA ligase [bacterium]